MTASLPTAATCQDCGAIHSIGITGNPESYDPVKWQSHLDGYRCMACADPMTCTGGCGQTYRASLLRDGICPNCQYSRRIGRSTGSTGQDWFLERG